jgi:hypothetical protein
MKVLQVAGAAALCGALLLTACAKKTDQSTTASTDNTTTTTQSADASPAADATTMAPATDASPASAASPASGTSPAATATTTTSSAGGTTVSTSAGNGTSDGYIDLPVYPGATEMKDQAISSSSNGSSVAIKIYTTKDDAKKVAEWYKSHLPSSWKNGILTAGGKTVGTFADEHADGDQSVVVANQDDGTSRIQLATKHGK